MNANINFFFVVCNFFRFFFVYLLEICFYFFVTNKNITFVANLQSINIKNI